MNHTVITSDVHLCEAVPGDGLWMRYRQKRFFPDAEFAELFDRMCAEVRGDALEVVFNGDLFDFDAPPVIDGEVRFDDQPRTEPVAVATLTRILDDHDVLVAALGRVLARGHRVVFVSGNHDAQLAFPGVTALITARLVRAAREAGAVCSAAGVAARVVFRTWFYTTPNGVHVEHGNQYDHFCSFRYPTEPYGTDGRSIQPTMGSLSFRYLVSRMGYFNPHVDSSFMLSLPAYLAHWARYYLFTRRSLGTAWALGALRIVATTWRTRTRRDAARAARMVTAYASRAGIDPAQVGAHAALFAPPSEDAQHSMFRELWLDRAALVGVGAAVTAGALLGGALAMTKVALVAGAAITGYELAVPKRSMADTYAHIAGCARAIARIHGARGVVFGHTHVPLGGWENGVFFGNTGTWSAAFRDVECTEPVAAGRPVIWLYGDGTRDLRGGLQLWRDGELLAWPRDDPRSIPPTAMEALGAPVPG